MLGDCGQNSDFTCVNGTCNTNRYPNDPCTANVQCFSNNCTNGFCVSNKVNQSCTGNDCVPGSFCNPATNTCQTSLKLVIYSYFYFKLNKNLGI